MDNFDNIRGAPDFFNMGTPQYDAKFSRLYEEGIRKSENIKTNKRYIIRLADIPSHVEETRLALLDTKLDEYTERLEGQLESFKVDFQKEPRNTVLLLIDTTYKRDFLRILMEKGELDSLALTSAVMGMVGENYSEAHFNNAFAVIRAYVETGGVGNYT